MVETIALINLVLLHVIAVPATLFPIGYFVFFNWRLTRPGQAVLLSSISVAALVDLAIVGFWFGDDMSRMAIAIINLAGHLYLLTAATYLIVVLARSVKKTPGEDLRDDRRTVRYDP